MICEREPAPSFGFNSEVSHRGRTYHVQTENLLSDAIHTLVYLNGALVKKVVSTPTQASSDEIEDLVRRQHLEVLATITHGAL